MRGAEAGPGRDFASWRAYVHDDARPALLRHPLRTDGAPSPLDRYAAHLAEAPPGSSLLRRMLHADFSFYLPSDMLVKVDRMSMRHSLEVRVPFLDQDFVNWTYSVPSRLLYDPRTGGKMVLRRHIIDCLGEQFLKRKKRGFNVPVSAGFKAGLRTLLLDTIHSEPFKSSGPLKVSRIEEMADEHLAGRRNHGHPLYVIMSLALWWNRWLQPASR